MSGILTTVTPYKNQPQQLASWCKTLEDPVLATQYFNKETTLVAKPYPKLPGLRIAPDGTFWIPHPTKEQVAQLDKEYHKVDSNRWAVRTHDLPVWRELIPVFNGKGCYIIGKGPSLDAVCRDVFINADWPIIAINESVNIILGLDLPNPVYGIQVDPFEFNNKCKNMIVETVCSNLYSSGWMFSRHSIGLPQNSISAECAVRLGVLMGVTEFVMIGFDAITDNKLDYATKIGHPAKGDLSRFKRYASQILRAAGSITCTFLSASDLDRVLEQVLHIQEPSIWDDPSLQVSEHSHQTLTAQCTHPQHALHAGH